MQYDLVVVGGGLVGAGLLEALRSSGMKMALIDARQPTNNDPRLFALNACSCHFLKNLNLWSQLKEVAGPIQQVHVSHQGRFGAVRLRSQDVGLPTLGNVVPARFIEAVFNEALTTLPSCKLYRPAKLKSLQPHADNVTLKLETEEGETVIQSKFVVGADGADSIVRRDAGIEAETLDYAQSALVTQSVFNRSHQSIAYERFTKSGAIAMLPLKVDGNDKICATIWSADNKEIATLMSYSDADFLPVLQKAFGYRIGRLIDVKARVLFPLKKICAKQNYSHRIYLLGNAAHTIHPIAAQGFNLATYEVAMLAEYLANKYMSGEPHAEEDLCALSQKMRPQQENSIDTSHRLSTLFATQSILKQLLLQVGMTGFDLATPIKRNFINQMMGRKGCVPRLLLNTTAL